MIDLEAIFEITPRQAQVTQLLAAGFTADQVAERLFILPDTVRTHVHHVHNRIGVHTLAEMAEWAIRAGLLAREESILAQVIA